MALQSTSTPPIAAVPQPAGLVRYEAMFDAALAKLHGEGRYRVFIDILRNKGSFPDARCFAGHNGPKPITVWCSNDYLSMGQHPEVIAAMEAALHDVGAGSGGTRNIGGNTHYHIDLEAELADLHGKEGALLFTSGYISNEATLSTLAKVLPGCVIFSDALNHASMIAGIRSSGCEKKVDHVFEVFDMPALVRADGNALHVFLQCGRHHFVHRSVVSQVDHFGAHALQDAAHDVDGCIMAVEQAGGSDKAHLVRGAVIGEGLEFGGQVGHGGAFVSGFVGIGGGIS